MANSYEVFLDNIFRQAEFIGHKIDKKGSKKSIDDLLRHNFSLGINLDTSLISSWVKFKWTENNAKTYNDLLNTSKRNPWLIHFGSLHSTSINQTDHYIPVSFGITDKKNNFIGSLTSKIDISSVIKFLQRNIKGDHLNILILDKKNNIIGHSLGNEVALPSNFFKDLNFINNSGNIYKSFDLTNSAYISYKKLDSYPFTIVIGDDKDIIFRPLINTLLKYFFVLVLVLIVILALLFIFYTRIINPITSSSAFAKDIISSDRDQKYDPKEHSFVEISTLEKALIKINDYKKDLNNSNRKLSQRTEQLALVKKDLERDLQKLSKSYHLRDSLFKQSLESKTDVPATEALEQCLTMLYPEIYSRQLEIIKSLDKTPNLNIKYCSFIKIVTEILSRSFMFSSKNAQIDIKTKTTILNDVNHFSLTIEDNGIGDEEWRRNSLNECCKIEETVKLIKEAGGILHCIDNKESKGVKYCILLPYKTLKTMNRNKVIQFPYKKPKS